MASYQSESRALIFAVNSVNNKLYLVNSELFKSSLEIKYPN